MTLCSLSNSTCSNGYNFDLQMEKDAVNYMQHKMGFCQKILMADEAVPTRFHCQKDRQSRLSDCTYSRGAFLKRQRINLVTECLQSQSSSETQESLQDDDMTQEIIEPEGMLYIYLHNTTQNIIILNNYVLNK